MQVNIKYPKLSQKKFLLHRVVNIRSVSINDSVASCAMKEGRRQAKSRAGSRRRRLNPQGPFQISPDQRSKWKNSKQANKQRPASKRSFRNQRARLYHHTPKRPAMTTKMDRSSSEYVRTSPRRAIHAGAAGGGLMITRHSGRDGDGPQATRVLKSDGRYGGGGVSSLMEVLP